MSDEQETNSIFDTLAQNAPPEYVQGEDLPHGAYALMRVSDHENALPSVYYQQFRDGSGAYKFKLALVSVGGDGKLDAKRHANRFVFTEMFVKPGEKERDNPGPIGGRLSGFLNAMFAPGVENEDGQPSKRWAVTVAALRETAKRHGISLAESEGDTGLFLARVAAQALTDLPREVIIKTKVVTNYKDKAGNKVDLDKPRVEVGSFEDASPANETARKIVRFETTSF